MLLVRCAGKRACERSLAIGRVSMPGRGSVRWTHCDCGVRRGAVRKCPRQAGDRVAPGSRVCRLFPLYLQNAGRQIDSSIRDGASAPLGKRRGSMYAAANRASQSAPVVLLYVYTRCATNGTREKTVGTGRNTAGFHLNWPRWSSMTNAASFTSIRSMSTPASSGGSPS